MKEWFFSGVVHPERAGVTLGRVEVSGADRAGLMEIFGGFTVSRGLISGQVQLPPEHDRFTALMIARQLVQRQVDIVGFVDASGYDVEIHTVVPAADPLDHVSLGVRVDYLADDSDRLRRQRIVAELPQDAFLGPEGVTLYAALANIRSAIRSVDHSGFFAYLAVEAIRQHFVNPTGRDRTRSWSALHAALDTTQGDLDDLTPLATAIRHGESIDVAPTIAAKYMRLAFRCVEAFMAHLSKRD
jgi:hypothetical protein